MPAGNEKNRIRLTLSDKRIPIRIHEAESARREERVSRRAHAGPIAPAAFDQGNVR